MLNLKTLTKWQHPVAVLAESQERGRLLALALAECGFDVNAVCIIDECPCAPVNVRDAEQRADGEIVAECLERKCRPVFAGLSRTEFPADQADDAGWAGGVFRLGPLNVDRLRSVAQLGGVQLDISDMLFDLLLELCNHWPGGGGNPYIQADWNDIYFLRHAFGGHRDLIVTCRGRGYRLAQSHDEAQAIADEKNRRRSRQAKSRGIRVKRAP